MMMTFLGFTANNKMEMVNATFFVVAYGVFRQVKQKLWTREAVVPLVEVAAFFFAPRKTAERLPRFKKNFSVEGKPHLQLEKLEA